MVFNYLDSYNLMQILIEEGLHSVKTDSKTLQEFSSKFINITDELKKASKDIDDDNTKNIDIKLIEEFQNFRNKIYRLEYTYFEDKKLQSTIQEINNGLKNLIKDSSKIITKINTVKNNDELKELFSPFKEFNEYLQKKIIDNSSINNNNFKNDLNIAIKEWQKNLDDYLNEKEKKDNNVNPPIYESFKEGNGFIEDDNSGSRMDFYFFHENLFYNLVLVKNKFNDKFAWDISFSADYYDVNFIEFIKNFKNKSNKYINRNLKDTQGFWSKLITIVKYSANNYNIEYFKFKGINDDRGEKISSKISEKKIVKTFELFNQFLFANADKDSEIPAQKLIRWIQQYSQDWRYSLNLRIKEIKEYFFDLDDSSNNKIKQIDINIYLKIIPIIKNDKESFENEKKLFILFLKKYNSIKEKLQNLNINNLKSGPLFKTLNSLNEDISELINLEKKIYVARNKIEKFVEDIPDYKKTTKLLKKYNMVVYNNNKFFKTIYSETFLNLLNQIKVMLILTLGFSLIKYAINKERITKSKKTEINKKNIYIKKSIIIKKINSILYNLIEYFKIFINSTELTNNFNSILNFIETLTPNASKVISKEDFKSILIDTIDTINNKYKFTKRHEDFDNRLELYMSNLKNNMIKIENLKNNFDFDFSPFQIIHKNIMVHPGVLLELTKAGKLALMNARDKRYYKILLSYGIKDENIFFDNNKDLLFSVK